MTFCRLALQFRNCVRCSVRAQARRSMSAATPFPYNSLQPYDPPSWAKDLKYHPTEYIQLAMRPTPLHRWQLPGVPAEFQVWIKRDDMTGSTLSGNKVRKLEFLLADALHHGCDSVVTCGSIQSNHARATAVAARQLGIKPHLVLRWLGEIDPAAVGCNGNLLLDRLSAATVVLVPPGTLVYGKEMKGLKHKMQIYVEKLRAEGSMPYLIPVGGSNAVGAWGYIEAFREMVDQGVLENFDDIVMPVGSGGTMCGVAIGNYLTGSKLKVHAVCVCDTADLFYQHIESQLEAFGLTVDTQGRPIKARDLVDIVDGYKGLGYGKSTEEELTQLVEIISQTGISLDPVYTLKGVRGMLGEMEKNPGRFAGKRVLYIHTGGVFGLYDGTVDKVLKDIPATNQVFNHVHVIPQ